MMAAIREGEDRLYGVVNVQPEYAAGGSGLEAVSDKVETEMSNNSSNPNGNGASNGDGATNGLARHLNWSNIPVEQVADGIESQMLVGHQMMICRFRFKPFLVTPEHDHPHEQMTIVEQGRVRFFIEGNERIAKAGDVPFSLAMLARRDDDGRGSGADRYFYAPARRFL